MDLITDQEFDREMRKYFRNREQRAHRRTVGTLVVIAVTLTAANLMQAWLYAEMLPICGVRP